MNATLRKIIHKLIEQSGDACPDDVALRVLFRLFLGRRLDLESPSTFNEKLQWLKLNYRPGGMEFFVDKSSAKRIAGARCPEIRIIPTLDLWENPDDIDIASLPERFILKPVNGGGGNVMICRDKDSFDISDCRRWARRALRTDIHARYREFCYKAVRPAILAEPLICDPDNLPDYKFFCFGGVPRFLKVDSGRFNDHRSDYFDMEFHPAGFGEKSYPPSEKAIVRPELFGEMKKAAAALSAGFPFVRIDLYEHDGAVWFGEFTFFPRSGLGEFYPDSADMTIGSMLTLPAL